MAVDRATTYKSELRPLPMRVSQLQYERLVAARNRDGLSIQEHVRRSLDLYLAKLERDFSRDNDNATSPPTPLANPTISGLRSRRALARLVTK